MLQVVAAGLGFEPRRTAPKTVVLPLDDPASPSFIIFGLNSNSRSLKIELEKPIPFRQAKSICGETRTFMPNSNQFSKIHNDM